MRALTYTEYGPADVLTFTEVARPVPKDDEVLIKTWAASVNPLDWHFMRGKPFFVRLMIGGLLRPKDTRLGVDVAGRVEAVGRNVTQFKPGDEVFGVCRGAFAEYACAPEGKVTLKPANLSFEGAAAVPVAATTALQALRDRGRIRKGQRVLVDGASGGVGTFAIQIAKSFGADVTAVCSTGNVDTARSIGADQVIDYTREDFTKNAQRYDLILGANAYHSVFAYRRALSPNGIFVGSGGGGQSFPGMLIGLLVQSLLSLAGSRKMRGFMAKVNKEDLVFLKDLLAAGRIVPVIDRQYPLSEVADALRYVEAGHAKAKVVITMGDRGEPDKNQR